MSIPLGARDTKLESGRELTKRNLLARPIFEKEACRLFSFKPDKGRTSPDLQSGQAI